MTKSEKFDPPAILERKLTEARREIGRLLTQNATLRDDIVRTDKRMGAIIVKNVLNKTLVQRALPLVEGFSYRGNESRVEWVNDARRALGEKR